MKLIVYIHFLNPRLSRSALQPMSACVWIQGPSIHVHAAAPRIRHATVSIRSATHSREIVLNGSFEFDAASNLSSAAFILDSYGIEHGS